MAPFHHVQVRHHYSEVSDIVGIVVGGLVLLAWALFIARFCKKYQRAKVIEVAEKANALVDHSALKPDSSTRDIAQTSTQPSAVQPIRLDPNRHRTMRYLGDSSSESSESDPVVPVPVPAPVPVPFLRNIPYLPPIKEMNFDEVSWRSLEKSSQCLSPIPLPDLKDDDETVFVEIDLPDVVSTVSGDQDPDPEDRSIDLAEP